jgi:hypothetical protein
MFTYKQSTGQLFNSSGLRIGVGFSGYGENRNKPELQNVSNVGCIPKGKYTIGNAYKHDHLGPVVMNLIPDPDNSMFGRSLFRIHGVSYDNPLTAENETLLSSHGCICMDRKVRELVAASDDKELLVIE